MTEPWRCFVAVPLPSALRSRFAEVVTAWHGEPSAPDLRWTAPDGWHLTLAFLGTTEPASVPAILDALRSAVARHPAWTARTGALGAFPGSRRGRVVWFAVSDPGGRLGALAAAVRHALEPMAPTLRTTSPFRPHVTLARARDPRGADVTRWLAEHQMASGVVPVDRVVLYRSHLGGRAPAAYEALGSVLLNSAGDAMMSGETEASVDG